MSVLRVLAIDDEPLALQRLEWCLKGVANVELIGKARDGIRGLELIESRSPDVVLLDIEMPEISGFDVLESLAGERVPEIIFVTAFDRYAVQAFEVSAVDYLLKPIERPRLRQALERARSRLELHDASSRVAELREVVNTLRSVHRPSMEKRYESEFWVREGDTRVRVPVAAVERLEADGNYVRLHAGERVRVLRATLHDLAVRLDPERFIRVSRGLMVRADLILAIRRAEYGRRVARLVGGIDVPIGRVYFAEVSRALRLRAPPDERAAAEEEEEAIAIEEEE